MYTRAKEFYDIWRKQTYPNKPDSWENFSKAKKRAWYEVAAAEYRNLERYADDCRSIVDEMKREMATMVKRKHYTDAIKSLSVCQQQIETMMVELRRLDPKNVIAGDADIVLGMLETMINFNPDMQTEDWKADAKAKQDVRDAEYEKNRSEAFAKRWEGATMADNKYNGTVKKEHKP